jgi:flagellar hook-length control protein FliK
MGLAGTGNAAPAGQSAAPPASAAGVLPQGLAAATPALAPRVGVAVATQTGAPAVPLSNLGLLAFNIAAQTRNGIKKFDIALHPADLGSIAVQMSLAPNGTAQLHLQAANPQTLQLLRQDAPQLQNALKDAGINLAGNGLNFSLQGQQQNAQGFTSGSGSKLMLAAVPATDSQAITTIHASQYSGSGRLDIKV